MPEASTERAARDRRWTEVPAPRGGIWLVAIGSVEALVIAPPGVALSPDDDPEALDSWRVGTWPLNEHGWLARAPDQPITTHEVTTADILADLSWVHYPWVREVMRLQLAQHEAFATPQAGELTDEERSRRAAQALHNLREELQRAFPHEDWYKGAVRDIPVVPETDVDLLAAIDGQRPRSPVPALDGAWAFYRYGDTWTIGRPGRHMQLRDSTGLGHIARLLAVPYAEFHALELFVAGRQVGGIPRGYAVRAEIEVGAPRDGDSEPVLDSQAAAYRMRIEELQDEIDDAESFDDPERASRARKELIFIKRELAYPIGRHDHPPGRERKTSAATEQARVSVTRAIRTALRRITERDASLGRRLGTDIRTGTFCVYEPGPNNYLHWNLTGCPRGAQSSTSSACADRRGGGTASSGP